MTELNALTDGFYLDYNITKAYDQVKRSYRKNFIKQGSNVRQ